MKTTRKPNRRWHTDILLWVLCAVAPDTFAVIFRCPPGAKWDKEQKCPATKEMIPQQEELLGTEKFQKQCAEAIYQGLVNFLENVKE